MDFQASCQRWGLAESTKEKVHTLMRIVSGLLETRGLAILSWPNGDE
jgi:uncharacterized ferritin-like protein (DUF455 family)